MEKADQEPSPANPSAQERKRLFIKANSGAKERAKIVEWAAINMYDALVFPLGEKLSARSEYIKLAKRYSLFIEAGRRDLSFLLPRKLFMFHRELFRMEQGKRKRSPHFCTTNPETTSIIAENALEFFTRSMPMVTVPRVFHLLPAEKAENIWCACPACRAFSPSEQNIITVNIAADVLAGLDPQALLSFYDYGNDPETEGIAPRKNMFKLKLSSPA